MFVLLALIFGVGFVVFGVGGGIPGTSLGDILRNSNGTSSGPSTSELQKRIAENPKDAQAYLDLATNYQQDGDRQQAISTLERYTQLRPKDTDALSQLGSLYLAQATTYQTEAARAQAAFADANPGAFLPTLLAGGKPVLSNPVIDPVSQQASTRFNEAYANMQGAYSSAVATYRRITKASPNDPQAQLQLAQAAQTGGDFPTAIGAYQAFLRLSPGDENAPFVRQQIRRLQAAQAQQAQGAGASSAG